MSENSNLMYLMPSCPYCTMAKKLLADKGVAYETLDVTGRPDLWQEIEDKTGRHTVPQIFLNGTHVGGFDDLYAADQSGKLDQILSL